MKNSPFQIICWIAIATFLLLKPISAKPADEQEATPVELNVDGEVLSCKGESSSILDEYAGIVPLTRRGNELSEPEGRRVLNVLTHAVDQQCTHAAMKLIDIKARELAAMPPGSPKEAKDALYEEIHTLHQAALLLGEGRVDLARFYLLKDGPRYSPDKALEMVNLAARADDLEAVKWLAGIYKDGAEGMPAREWEAPFWERRALALAGVENPACQDLPRLTEALEQANNLRKRGKLKAAAAIADKAIDLVGNRYDVPDVEDDTDLIIFASQYAVKDRNWVAAANLKLRALRGRIDLFKTSQSCLKKQ